MSLRGASRLLCRALTCARHFVLSYNTPFMSYPSKCSRSRLSPSRARTRARLRARVAANFGNFVGLAMGAVTAPIAAWLEASRRLPPQTYVAWRSSDLCRRQAQPST